MLPILCGHVPPCELTGPVMMLQRHVPSCELILFVQHQFGEYFVPVTCCTKFNLLNFIGHIAGTNRCKDAMKLCVYSYTVPATESKVESSRDNDQKFLCSCKGKNKMAAISSGARAVTFDWNYLDRKKKLLVILMTITDDNFFFFCLSPVCKCCDFVPARCRLSAVHYNLFVATCPRNMNPRVCPPSCQFLSKSKLFLCDAKNNFCRYQNCFSRSKHKTGLQN